MATPATAGISRGVPGSFVRRLAMCAIAGLGLVGPCAAPAVLVQKINLETGAAGARISLEFDQPPRINVVNQVKDKNYWYVDVYGLSKTYARSTRDTPADAAVRTVDFVNYPDNGVLRIVLYPRNPAVTISVAVQEQPPGLVVRALPAGASPAAPPPVTGATGAAGTPQTFSLSAGPSAAAMAAQPQLSAPGYGGSQVPAPLPSAPPPPSRGNQQKIVVIDPGHGGGDGGAASNAMVAGQIQREKDLALLFANELKKIIDKSGNMVAIVTRPSDIYIPLYDRARAAETANAELFISIHMNDGGGNASARGFEIYYLNERGTSSGAAKALEDRENREMGADARPKASSILGSILTDEGKGNLEKWKYEGYVLCRHLEQALCQYAHFRDHNRGVKSANFVVLKNFEMPAVLLEVGFITNTDDLKLLVDPQFQQYTAWLVYNGIAQYFQYVDPSFKPRPIRLGR